MPRLTPLALLTCLIAPSASADVLHETMKLLAPDGAPNDEFGKSVAMDGTTLLVGSHQDSDLGTYSGSAYLFDATTGAQLHKLLPSDGFNGQRFGLCVAIDGPYALVGATTDDGSGNGGRVYVFDVASGTELTQLYPHDPDPTDYFGCGLAVDGTTALVGAYQGDNANGTSTGAAYLFDLTTGLETAKLIAPDATKDDWFGRAVALGGGLAVVGAVADDDNGSASGSAYVFDANTGQFIVKLLPNDGATASWFGSDVAVSGTTVLVGSEHASDNDTFSGSAYVFDALTGAQLAKLLPEDGDDHDKFGVSVAISGDLAIIGAWGDEHAGWLSGSVYVYDIGTGTLVMKFLASDATGYENLGYAVAASGTTAIATAFRDDELGPGSGSAYLFDLSPLIGASYCGPAVPNSTGAPAVIEALGSDAVAEGCVVLRASQLPPDRFGYFLTSQTQGFVVGPGGSQGNLCLGGTIGRYSKQLASSGPAGRLYLSVDLHDMPPPVKSTIQPGETWNFQCWFRDKNPTPTSNFTDGVSIAFL